MRIAIVIDRLEPFYRGGYERRAWELARRLARRHAVTILTSAPENQILEGTNIVAVRPYVSYFKPDGFRDLGANLAYALGLMGQIARHDDFDVVDCNATPFLHIYPAFLLARKCRAAFLVTAHEALAKTMSGYFRARRSRLGPYAPRLARRLYFSSQGLADGIVAPSVITAAELRDEGFTEVEVCTGGVNRTYQPKQQSMGRAVFVGRLVRNKRVDRLIEAHALALKDGGLQSLTIVGGGPERERLSAVAVSLGVSSSVRFTGEVSDEIKWRILRDETDVFVSASPREGIAIAVLEALAAGNPAIITHIPDDFQQGATEYLSNGYNGIVTDGSVQNLARALHNVCGNSENYAAMSRNAINTASRYTWDSAALTLERIYEGAKFRMASGPTTRSIGDGTAEPLHRV